MEHTILVTDWIKEEDKYFVHIPFECNPDEDTIIEFIDTDDYIQEHKEDFDSLNNGESNGVECVISADKMPSCDMKVEIKTVSEAGGRVMYDKNGSPEYIPPESNGFSGLAGMLGSIGGLSNIENLVSNTEENQN